MKDLRASTALVQNKKIIRVFKNDSQALAHLFQYCIDNGLSLTPFSVVGEYAAFYIPENIGESGFYYVDTAAFFINNQFPSCNVKLAFLGETWLAYSEFGKEWKCKDLEEVVKTCNEERLRVLNKWSILREFRNKLIY